MLTQLKDLKAHHGFTGLAISRFISNVGNGVSPIALAYGVLSLPGSTGADLSIVMAARFVPLLAFMLFGGVISRLVSGLLADRLGGVTTLLIGSTLQTIGLMLYLPFDGLVPLYVVSAIFGLSQGGIVPSYAVIVREYLPAREAGARVGFVMMATILGMALGGWMSGWIYDQTGSYLWAFLNGIGWNVLNIGIVVLLIYRARTARRPAMA